MPTCSLKSVTKQVIVKPIKGLINKSALIISANWLFTLYRCSQILELKQGKFLRIDKYQDFVAKVEKLSHDEFH